MSRNSSVQTDGFCALDDYSNDAPRLYEPDFAQELHGFLNIESSVEISYRTIRHEDYKIKCSLNRYHSGGSVYAAAGLETDMFDFVLRISFWGTDDKMATRTVKKILQFYWDKQIPAAMSSIDIDERDIKWLGGNQLSQVFWEDKHFTKAMYRVFCESSSSIDYSV